MEHCFIFADGLGATRIVPVCEPPIQRRATLAVGEVARRPAIGPNRTAKNLLAEIQGRVSVYGSGVSL
jgi:hypothetical protein